MWWVGGGGEGGGWIWVLSRLPFYFIASMLYIRFSCACARVCVWVCVCVCVTIIVCTMCGIYMFVLRSVSMCTALTSTTIFPCSDIHSSVCFPVNPQL